jgi:hypothetical protein
MRERANRQLRAHYVDPLDERLRKMVASMPAGKLPNVIYIGSAGVAEIFGVKWEGYWIKVRLTKRRLSRKAQIWETGR